ncbi:MAG: GNAT family N-acetyltransferase [Actinomycetota bacterium]
MTSEAWDEASAAAETAHVRLRPLTSIQDADAILRVMIATWGNHQLLPREEILALAESGNIPWGAEAEGEMIGYVLGWAGIDPEDGLHVHSHMLAALPDRRHRGVGYALKLAQRAACLDQGINLIRWTFDPMVSRNAWFNLGKLGATADRFRRDFYGAMVDSLNAGERSDRLVVRWDLDRPPGPRARPAVVREEVAVPREYDALRASDPGAASATRERVADALEASFAAGNIVVAFDGPEATYCLASEPSE